MAHDIYKLTEEGKKFIKNVCSKAPAGTLLGGTNGPLPYSKPEVNKTWTANVEGVTTNEELGEELISLFEKYAKKYNLDASILAAQAYAESGYKVWNYAPNSDASGLGQFTMQTIYEVIVLNNSYGGVEGFTNAEIEKITNGLAQPEVATSYNPRETVNVVAKENRETLHQNIIDNLEIMVKAQARYMRYIANNSDNLASAALFGYSRGPAYATTTYSKTVQNCITAKSDAYAQEGLNYVTKIFAILGQPSNNDIIKDSRNDLRKGFKPDGYSFGYEKNKYEGGEDRLFNLLDEFDSFGANVSESDDYGIVLDNVENLSIAKQTKYPYKLIYFPEDQYKSGPENKITNKIQIVLHHTVSGPSVQGDVYYWENNGEKVATAFLVSRLGEIYQLYNSEFWGIHLFLNNDPFVKMENEYGANYDNIPLFRQNMEKQTIGIEIDSWGGLTQKSDGTWVNAYNGDVSVDDVQLYDGGFRGYKGFEKYTQIQIDAVGALLRSLKEKYSNISLKYNDDMWDFSPNAMNRQEGVWTHVSYREDKSDCHPQPELITMLQSLGD